MDPVSPTSAARGRSKNLPHPSRDGSGESLQAPTTHASEGLPGAGGSGQLLIAPETLFALQRTIGNRATSRLLSGCAPRDSGSPRGPTTASMSLLQRQIDEATAKKVLRTDKLISGWSKKPDAELAGMVIAASRRFHLMATGKEASSPDNRVKVLEILINALGQIIENISEKDRKRKAALIDYLREATDAHANQLKSMKKAESQVEEKEFKVERSPYIIKEIRDLFRPPSSYDEGGRSTPAIEDIAQGGLGNCFLLSALIALVNNPPEKVTKGGNPLAGIFTELVRPTTVRMASALWGGGEEPDFTKPDHTAIVKVRLFRKTGLKSYEPEYLPVEVGGKGARGGYDIAPWAITIADAYAMLRGGYEGSEGGQGRDAFNTLFGEDVEATRETERFNMDFIRAAFKDGKLVTISTNPSSGGDKDTVKGELGAIINLNHAYALIGFKGADVAVIRNPHGTTLEITEKDLSAYFYAGDTAKF